MKLSCYTYLFRATQAGFDLDGAIENFAAFFDEVSIATVPLEGDDTYERLFAWQTKLGSARLKVHLCKVPIEGNNRFDGQLKTLAMEGCTHDVRIIADCDERFVLAQRPAWDALAEQLLSNQHLDGWSIPVVDLYGGTEYIRANEPLGLKFRMHKRTVTRRGVPAFAEKGGGLFDTSRSDSTEPLTASGALASFICPYPMHVLHPTACRLLEGSCYVVHHGFVNLQKRADLGRTFWKHHWEARSGRTENVATTVNELADVPLMKHGLTIA